MSAASTLIGLHPARPGAAADVIGYAFESLTEAGWPTGFAFPDMLVWDDAGEVHTFPHGVGNVGGARRAAAAEVLAAGTLCDRCAREWMSGRVGAVQPADPQRVSVWSRFSPISPARLGQIARYASDLVRGRDLSSVAAWQAGEAERLLADVDELIAVTVAADQSDVAEFRASVAALVAGFRDEFSYRELPTCDRARLVVDAQAGPAAFVAVWRSVLAGDGPAADALRFLDGAHPGLESALAVTRRLAAAQRESGDSADVSELVDWFACYTGSHGCTVAGDAPQRAAAAFAARLAGWVAASSRPCSVWRVVRVAAPSSVTEWVAWQAAVRVFPNVALGPSVRDVRLVAFPAWFELRWSPLAFVDAPQFAPELICEDPLAVLAAAVALDADAAGWDLARLVATAAAIVA